MPTVPEPTVPEPTVPEPTVPKPTVPKPTVSKGKVPTVKVLGLDHIVLRCGDVEKALAFYCDALGLAGERVAEWRRGEVLFPSVRVTPTTVIDLFAAERDGVNLDHFCLVIEPADLDALAAQFPGAQRADGLFGAQGFASSLYIPDPDGNTVELRSYA